MRWMRVWIWMLAAIAISACDDGPTEPVASQPAAVPATIQIDEPGANQPIAESRDYGRTTWSDDALKTAQELSGKLTAAEFTCRDYSVIDIRMYDEAYRRRLPVMPAAVASCDAHGGEDILFEVFENPEKARQFMDDKLMMLCRRAASMQIIFPGIPYVDGGHWIVEPDEQDTTETIAPILGGTAKYASCG